MARLANDHKSCTVESGDTLSQIALTYSSYTGGLTYKQLASINNISNPDRIYVGQVIKFTASTSGGTGGSGGSTSNPSTAVINQFGLQSNSDGTLFATWTWGKSNTDHYEIEWTYDTGNGVWFIGSKSTTEDNQSTYSIPNNANFVRFRVKPVSKTYKKNNSEVSYWTAGWTDKKQYDVRNNPPLVPPVPDVEIEKYKLTASLDNLVWALVGDQIEFQVVKNTSSIFASGVARISFFHASFSCNVDAGGEYTVRCRTVRGSYKTGWSNYSSAVDTIPAAPSSITECKALSRTSVYLAWTASTSATTYEIEYATKKEYFEGSNQTNSRSGIETTHYELAGLEAGNEYFFRVRATNSKGSSSWSGIKSVVIGRNPSAPTTWSSTSTAIVGDPVVLYWIHNSTDGSSQVKAELELTIDGVTETEEVINTDDEDERDKTSFYNLDTSSYSEGTQILWRVRTQGVTHVYGDWSMQRTIDAYAPATLELSIRNQNDDSITTITSFPFYVKGLTAPNTQAPIGYSVSIISNEVYETVDRTGVRKIINSGEKVYSKYFDTTLSLLVELSAGNIDLENGVSYTLICTAAMNSGLVAESSVDFTVSWEDVSYEPNAEIAIDEDTYSAYITPYCVRYLSNYYVVEYENGEYVKTSIEATVENGVPILSGDSFVYTPTGEQVYEDMDSSEESSYYCLSESSENIDNVYLSVYRREYDGTFTEIASGLDSAVNSTITDPHPSLDYARYRIVATDKDTGAVSYYDVPGYPVGGISVIIQWNEDWSEFDASEGEVLETPAWSGSMLKLPYNIDVSDKHSADVSLVSYIGRKHPVTYYGTQLGETATWNVNVPKSDKDTIYALRRLAIWQGDVYVREPSGSGYWANINVSFSQKHMDLVVPVTLELVRVEGGV